MVSCAMQNNLDLNFE